MCKYNRKKKRYSNDESFNKSDIENKNKQKHNNKANNERKSLNFIAAENYDDNYAFDANADLMILEKCFSH